ncbi:DNA-binding PadR family transcriptional regulator [Arthrobacter stackebrandtii]|uniref:DNA-binding PadR family transcriptional regulator n=1 Tax=Arthrobacter stackebrandtii TaxID=272161 RepID=A0ABS4YYD1_9MICC|nr:PadR family transcriptional regulator [Arthrobacter stackebrandtii]MBP2413580.1 DNA-binding PadR family transcriptional regulator [Arthrobacter stackebrandtii]PYH00597.1 PadR family transcriptional regulator [Arthrobacter stackebrandtii]
MNENTFWILTALAGGRRHGYAILRDVAELADGKVSLRVTTLYASLERLEREGFVARAGEEIVDGRARRYYELTDDGIAALTLETERLAVRLGAAEKRLAAPRPAAIRPSPATMVWGFAG